MREKNIIPDDKFFELKVIGFHHKEKKVNGRTKYYYLCKCDCGKEVVVEKWNLITGHSKSCGCRKNKQKHTTHGLSKQRIYNIWSNMKQRCYNEKNKEYNFYGSRGVKICDEWKNSFEKFCDWAFKNGYKDNLTIDRINNNGSYFPDNCRWATMECQNRNRRSNKIIKFKGEVHCLSEWAKIKNIKQSTLNYRIRNGWDVEKAFKYK